MEFIKEDSIIDVIIIGAGLSGLSAGNYLLDHDPQASFIVLEARDRVGGRCYTIEFEGQHPIDLGAAYVGPYQNRILRLARELKIETYQINTDGKNIFTFSDGRRVEYVDVVPPAKNPFSFLDINHLLCRTQEFSEAISTIAPWSNEKLASTLDQMTIEDWINSVAETEYGKETYRVFPRSLLCVEPCEVSMLFWVRFVNSGLGILRLSEATNGAQERKFKGGTNQISKRLHEKLGYDRVRLNHVVEKIQWSSSSHIKIECSNGKEYVCRHVIIALPPSLYKSIRFEPTLPAEKNKASEQMVMGFVIKTFTIYERPFWKERGFSGILLNTFTEKYPVVYAYDDSVPQKNLFAIMGSILADSSRAWRNKSRDERQKAVCEQYRRAFKCDEMVTGCRAYIEFDWSTEEYSGGGYTNIMPVNLITSLHDHIRKPCEDKIFFAGTEVATRWTGYMDGAVQTGERAAFEIITKYLKPRRGEDGSHIKWIEEEPIADEEDCRPPSNDKLFYGPSRIAMLLPRGSTLYNSIKAVIFASVLFVSFILQKRFYNF